MDQKLESINEVFLDHPRCEVRGCREEPTLAVCKGWSGVFRYFCDKHREDKKREAQRLYSWRHKLKTKYGITTINVRHVPVPDKEIHENLKVLNRKHPNLFMDADEWKERRNREKEIG